MNEIIIHTFSRREIEQLDFSAFDQTIGNWPSLRGQALKQKFNSLVILMDGYNEHSDEVYCIPEVRNFMAELHRRWPWWSYFLKNEEAFMSIPYLCLLNTIQSYKVEGAPDCAAAFDPHELLPIIEHDFGRMNFLMDRAGMSDEENDKRTEEIICLFLPQMKGLKNG